MSVWLPTWATDLAKRQRNNSQNPGNQPGEQDDRPLLLTAEQRQRQVVGACCERAASVGVHAGMPLAQARAMFQPGGVRLESARPEHDARRLRALAAWAQRLSPVVAVDGVDGLLLDVTGCQAVFGGEESMVRSARAHLRDLGVRARVAIAPTFGAAWAMARHHPEPGVVLAQGDLRRSLAPLPIEALRLAPPAAQPRTVEALREVGLDRVGHLLDLPRSTLPARFGDGVLLRLDQALGQAIETIEPVRPVPPPVVERVFEGPTDRTEAIELAVRELLVEVAALLGDRQAGARSVAVELVRSDLPPEVLTITLGRPSADAKHLWTLARPRLERAHLGFGVEEVRVRVGSVGPLRYRQQEMAGGPGRVSEPEAERAWHELLDTLTNRLGADRVVRAELAASHLPERAWRWRAVGAEPTAPPAELARTADRPTVLLDRPEPTRVVALTPDGPVHRVRWRGEDLGVLACVGPERIAPEWWRRRSSTRDYFRLQTERGEWLWVARSIENNRWFVQGVWA